MSIVFGPAVGGTLPDGATREWLVPDGCGGYAMGTVSGLRTRRYHALLVTSGSPPANRHVALASLDPVLELPSGAQVRLAVHEWASGDIGPDGHTYLERFELVDGLPRWRWRVGGVVLERELAMVHGRSALGVVHRLIAGGPVTLTLDALCTWRDAHGERYASGPPPAVATTADGVTVEDAYRLAGPGWESSGQWYLGAHLREEAARGLAANEDLWHAGRFVAPLAGPGDTVEVLAWAGDLADRPPPATAIVAAAHRRAAGVLATGHAVDETDAQLLLAADAFVVQGADGPDVVAGYPWFGAWSRDTMTSYEGLFLATGRAAEGRRLLLAYGATLSEGMLANTADTGQTEYNTVDATLWFVHAIGRHVAVTGDRDLAAELLPALEQVVAAHLAGTRYHIRGDSADSLLSGGTSGYALTWMDARIDGAAVTPRIGKPVEVNALWINALGTIGALRGEALPQYEAATASFGRTFSGPDGWLYDLIDEAGKPQAILRPNQLLAYGLPYAPLRGQRPPTAVDDELLTSLGLRSLAPSDPSYLGRHRGDGVARDRAYHQGTVWPWLIGPYVDAQLAYPSSDLNLDHLLDGLTAHLTEYGLGSISETADGQPPHAATGCPFQAWSVAEVLRVRRRRPV